MTYIIICVNLQKLFFNEGKITLTHEDRYAKYDKHEGPTEDEEHAARRACQMEIIRSHHHRSSPQGSYANIIGTPRHAKHRGGKINGVTLK